MEKPIKIESLNRNQDYPKSPEFEFWMVRNPSTPQHHILTADQLFSDGLLLPLHNIDHVTITSRMPQSSIDDVKLVPSDGHQLISTAAAAEVGSEPAAVSRRWKDIFMKSESKMSPTDQKVKLPKMRERRINRDGGGDGGGGGGGEQCASAAVLNIINIWPFSRSRSAKTNSPRSKVTTGGRKVSSAPCSRSNSGSDSESKSRKFRGSPARGGGVHIGRSSPVWQPRRGGTVSLSRLSTVDIGSGKGKNVQGCKAAVNGGDIGGGSRGGSGGSHGGSGVVNRFNFRSLFSSTRKVY